MDDDDYVDVSECRVCVSYVYHICIFLVIHMISNTNEYELYIKNDFSILKTSYPFPQYPSNIILVVSSLFNITHRIHGTYIFHKKNTKCS